MTGRLTLPKEIFDLIRDEVLKSPDQSFRCDRNNPVNGPFSLTGIEIVPGDSMYKKARHWWQRLEL